MRSPSRRSSGGRCSFGACCEHPAYECGTHTVRSPNTSVKISLGSDPPRLGSTAGFLSARLRNRRRRPLHPRIVRVEARGMEHFFACRRDLHLLKPVAVEMAA